MDLANGDVIEWKCQKAIVAFYRCFDERDYSGLLARIHPDGVWLRQGKELKGERQIMEAMHARSKTLRIHHLLSNVLVEVDRESERAKLFAYLLTYRHDDGEPRIGPAPLKGPWGIYVCNAEPRPVAGDWRIYRLKNTPTFEAGA